jgi:hypothetical protein
MTDTPIQIDKGIPIPPRRRLTPVGAEQLAALEVGDSFAIPIPPEYATKPTVWAGINRLRNSVYHYQKRFGRKFTVRCLESEVRVWRIS